MPPEPVSLHLKEHQTSIDDWEYIDLITELHRWVGLFDSEFKLGLPSYPVIQFGPLRNAYATYAWFRGSLGTKDNITFNTHELTRDTALILRTLCHELLHLWQQYQGQPSRGNYHNAEYRAKALECGLIVTPQGCTTGHTQRFSDALAKYGVHLAPLQVELNLHGARKRDLKMKAWRCQCPPRQNTVRCAIELRATCERCGIRFQRV